MRDLLEEVALAEQVGLDVFGVGEHHRPDFVVSAPAVVLAAFTAPDEGTAMEAWYAHNHEIPVVVYTGGTPIHPWTTYVAASVHAELEDAIGALRHLAGRPGL